MRADHADAIAPGQASGPVFDHYTHLTLYLKLRDGTLQKNYSKSAAAG